MTIDVTSFIGRRCDVKVGDSETGVNFMITGIVTIVDENTISVKPVSPLGGPTAPFGDKNSTVEIAKIRSITPA